MLNTPLLIEHNFQDPPGIIHEERPSFPFNISVSAVHTTNDTECLNGWMCFILQIHLPTGYIY